MKKLTLFTLLVSVLVAFGAPGAFAGTAKVSVCHIPPGNPDNFHTITVSEKALAAHLAHGDVAGACDSACATLCDDGNACTIDDTGDCEQLGCPGTRQEVDCNDGNSCTTDTCESTQGCTNTPDIGALCDDGQTCTGVDTCDSDGQCTGPVIPNCCLTQSDCSQDLCDQATCNTTTNECENAPVACEPSDLCHVSVCDLNTGDCAETPVTCGDGETCNVNTGECVSDVVTCPCLDVWDGPPFPEGTNVGIEEYELELYALPLDLSNATCTVQRFDGGGIYRIEASTTRATVPGCGGRVGPPCAATYITSIDSGDHCEAGILNSADHNVLIVPHRELFTDIMGDGTGNLMSRQMDECRNLFARRGCYFP